MPARSLLSLSCAAVLAVGALLASVPAQAAPPSDRGRPAPDLQTEAVPGELVVGYVDGTAPAARDRARGRAQAVFAEHVVPAEAGRRAVELVRLPQGKDRGQAIAELQSDPAVAYAEPNFIYRHAAVEPSLTSGQLWGMLSETTASTTSATSTVGVRATLAWDAPKGFTSTVYVGVIDEGIQVTHSDLDANVGNPLEKPGNRKDDDGNGYRDDTHGWDFVGNNNTVYDGGSAGSSDKHGTHVAGTIGAEHDAVGVRGVAPQVKMISGKFLGPSGGSLANAVKAVDYFTNLKLKAGLNVVATNNSWGGGGFSSSLNDAIARGARAGILFIAAAGNSSSNNDKGDYWPADYRTVETAGAEAVISVASLDADGGKSDFSSYGLEGVHLGAPGGGIYSTLPPGVHGTYSGTSMATPHVTGGAALYAAAKVLPYKSSDVQATRQAAMTTIRQALLNSVASTPSLSRTGTTPVATGGRLDVMAALSR